MSLKEDTKHREKQKQLRVAAYIRVSTEDQAEKYGPDMQKASIKAYVDSRGKLDDGRPAMILKQIYEDSISGTTKLSDRDGFAQLMEDIANAPEGQKPFDVIAVYKVDRFARRLKILLDVVEYFNDQKIEFLSVNESIDTSTPFGRAILNIMGVIAELEIETTKLRTQDGRKSSFSMGVLQGTANFGYTKNAEKKLIILEEEAKIVRMIFDLYIFEGQSTEDIAKRLRKQGVLTPEASAIFHQKKKGEPNMTNEVTFWRGSKVRKILSDEVYIGLLYGNKSLKSKKIPRTEWILSSYRHNPIIEEAVFNQAQKKMQDHANKTTLDRAKKQGGLREYLLRGLIKCDYCSKDNKLRMQTWHGTGKSDGSSFQYKCGGKEPSKHSKTCSVLPIPAIQLEEYVVNFVKGLLDDPHSTFEYQRQLQSNKIRIRRLESERKNLISNHNMIPSRRDNLSKQHEMGKLNDNHFEEKWDKIDEEEVYTKKRMQEISAELGKHALSEGYVKVFKTFSKKYRTALDNIVNNTDDIFVLLHALIEKIVVYSRPVNRKFDVVAGPKKERQQMPHEIKIELKLPQDIIAQLAEAKFGVKNSTLRRGRDSNP